MLFIAELEENESLAAVFVPTGGLFAATIEFDGSATGAIGSDGEVGLVGGATRLTGEATAPLGEVAGGEVGRDVGLGVERDSVPVELVGRDVGRRVGLGVGRDHVPVELVGRDVGLGVGRDPVPPELIGEGCDPVPWPK